MAKFKCPKCEKALKRDMRYKMNRTNLTKRGYKSYCDKYGVNVYCKEVDK